MINFWSSQLFKLISQTMNWNSQSTDTQCLLPAFGSGVRQTAGGINVLNHFHHTEPGCYQGSSESKSETKTIVQIKPMFLPLCNNVLLDYIGLSKSAGTVM